MLQQVALCDFSKITGWRVRAVSQSKDKRIAIVRFGSIKLLRLPLKKSVQAGKFFNPRKLLSI